jgi:hypothetical protein
MLSCSVLLHVLLPFTGPSQPGVKVPTTGTSSKAVIAEAQALAGPDPPPPLQLIRYQPSPRHCLTALTTTPTAFVRHVAILQAPASQV